MSWLIVVAVLAWAPSAVAFAALWRRTDAGYPEYLFWVALLFLPIVGPLAYQIMATAPRRGGAAIVLLAGAIAAWKVVFPALAALTCLLWLRVETTRVRVGGPWMNSMDVEYEYQLDTRRYIGHRYGIIAPETYLDENELLEIQGDREMYSVCYVAPWDHSSAVLVRSLPLKAYAWRAPFLVAAIALFAIRRRMLRT